MALFRSSNSKQRALVSRVCSVAVYYVHSHLQYTSASSSSHEQVSQGLEILPSQNGMSLLNDNQLQPQLRNHRELGSERQLIDNAMLPTALLDKTLPVDSLTAPAHLALMSLSYNEKWCADFKTAYNNAMKSRELLGYNKNARANKIRIFPREEFKARPDQFRANRNDFYQNVNSNVVMFSNNNKNVTKQKEAKKEKEDKCDPLLLALVYQALQDELPAFFQKGHGYDLYHKNVKFINGLTNTTLIFSGLRTYKCVMVSMRLAAQMCMSDISMEILKITQDNKECNIKVRWRVSGMPRYTSIIGNAKDGNNCRYVDGFSIFDVDVCGLIYCHRLLKLMPSQSPQTDNPLWALNTAAVIALLRQQKSFEMLARHRVEDIEDTCLPL